MPLNVQHSSLSISHTLSIQGSFHAGMSRKRIFFAHACYDTHAMFAPYKSRVVSRVVSRGGLLLPLTYLPGTSVGKKITFFNFFFLRLFMVNRSVGGANRHVKQHVTYMARTLRVLS